MGLKRNIQRQGNKRNSDRAFLPSLNCMADQILQHNVDNLIKIHTERAVIDPEAIHDLRVASRRLRAAIEAFKKILPSKAMKIHAKIRKLGRILGKKRNLDIFSQFIYKAIKKQKIARQIDKCQEQVLKTLKSKNYAKVVKLLKELQTVPTKKSSSNVSRKCIQKAFYKIIEIAPAIDPKADDKTLHRLRISVKKLRYICEFFQPIFSLRSSIAKMKKIQDILGEHQDALTGISLLKVYKNQFSVEEFLRIEKKYELAKIKTRKSFFKIWNSFYKEVCQRMKII